MTTSAASSEPPRLAIIGAGSMGSGLAALFALRGFPVVLVDPVEGALARADAAIDRQLAALATPEQARAARARLVPATALAAAAQADLVLVLPAGLDAHEAADLARAFAALGARHLLPTRLDAARRLGAVLAAAEAGPLLLTEGGTSPEVVDGLETLTPARLAARLAAAPRRGALVPAEEAAP